MLAESASPPLDDRGLIGNSIVARRLKQSRFCSIFAFCPKPDAAELLYYTNWGNTGIRESERDLGRSVALEDTSPRLVDQGGLAILLKWPFLCGPGSYESRHVITLGGC